MLFYMPHFKKKFPVSGLNLEIWGRGTARRADRNPSADSNPFYSLLVYHVDVGAGGRIVL